MRNVDIDLNWIVRSLIIAAIHFVSSAYATSDSSTPRVVSQSSRIASNVTAFHRSQGRSGLCYGFSVRSALEQFARRHYALSDSEYLSVLDVIIQGNMGNVSNGGDAYHILQSIRSKTRIEIATEKCMPIELHLNPDGTPWATQIREVFEQFYKSTNQNYDDLAKQISPLAPKHFSTADVRSALGRNSRIDAFLGRLYSNRPCKSTEARYVPTFNIGLIKDTEILDASTLKKTVARMIKENKPLIWNFCRRVINGVCVDGHSTLIVGYRETMFEDGSTKLDVLIHDSLPESVAFGINQHWVEESDFLNLSLREPKPQQYEDGAYIGYRTLLWIEPAGVSSK